VHAHDPLGLYRLPQSEGLVPALHERQFSSKLHVNHPFGVSCRPRQDDQSLTSFRADWEVIQKD
jgi:hypothetical protein